MAIPLKVCPECGQDMSKTTPEKHAIYHYPVPLTPANSSKLARERRESILKGGIPASEYANQTEEA